MKNARINKIITNDIFLQHCHKIEKAECGREFCGHGMAHFLDVARIAMILNLQERQEVPYDLIYAAALLHDIGRYEQYADKTPHEEASVRIALEILPACGFDDKETAVILLAMQQHRNPQAAKKAGLEGLLYRADKMSRACFACGASAACDWGADKKNGVLRY